MARVTWVSGWSVTLACVVASSGCSFLAPRTQRFEVRTSEPDARVYLNGALMGTGSRSYLVDRGQKVDVTVQKEGFYSVTRTIDRTFSVLGRLDTVGGYVLLLPLLGLLAPGAYQLEETVIDVRLRKEPVRVNADVR